MKKWLLAGASLVVLGFASGAYAADIPVKAPVFKAAPAAPVWNWTGLYIGAHVGGGLGISNFSDPIGPSIFGDNVRTPAFLGGGQIGYNWQAANSPWVYGVEADVSGLISEGTNTCFAFSGFYISANCHVRPDVTSSLTGRVGYATGWQGHTLLYGKGGAAWIHDNIDIAVNAVLPAQTTSATYSKLGWTIGGGVEQALTPAWSMSLEYDYFNFGNGGVTAPTSFFQAVFPNGYVATPPFAANVNQNFQEVKLGLNYRFGADPGASWDASSKAAYPVKAPPMVASGWEVEGGGRYWYSSGRFQKDLGAGPGVTNVLNSRLTYTSTGNSGEFFARIDSPYRVFVKGFIGGGSLNNGTMNDEDWLLFANSVPYSNTVSSVSGNMTYGTIDLGFNGLQGQYYKAGPFVGYNSYTENKSAYGCTQISNPNSDCVPAIPTSTLAITENDQWRSLRVGVNGEVMLTQSLKLSGDVAYLPYVKFTGTDDHVLRALVSPESGTGQGVQLEGIISYYVTPAFSIGAGGRYWAMWSDNSYTNFGGAPCPCQALPVKTERYGTFLQAAYKFGG